MRRIDVSDRLDTLHTRMLAGQYPASYLFAFYTEQGRWKGLYHGLNIRLNGLRMDLLEVT